MTDSPDEPDYSAPLFDLGAVRMTQGVLHLGVPLDTVLTLLAQHSLGLWGDVDEHDSLQNNLATVGGTGARVLSAYHVEDAEGEQTRIWVITDAEDDHGVRESTVVMLPSEY